MIEHSRYLDPLLNRFPSSVAAQIDLIRPSVRRSSDGPFNRQLIRTQVILEVLERIQPKTIIETGTYRGATTEFLASVCPAQIITIEVSARFAKFAERRFSSRDNVEVIHGDSGEALRQILNADLQLPLFVYLDAHWGKLPLAMELEALARVPQCVVVIDDFLVPGDPGFGYDTYEGWGPLSRDLVESLSPSVHAFQLFFPAAGSDSETGSRRGWAVLASPDTATSVSGVRGLRPA